jgi:addiction module HigA family antidote
MTLEPLAPIHPGELLREEFLKPLGLSAYRVAKDTGVPEPRIGDIVREKRGISADTALRLSRYFGISESYWTNAQAHYEREIAKDKAGEEIERIRPLASA